MKNFATITIACALVAAAFSPLSAQVRFGIKAGLNFANAPVSDDYKDYFAATLGGEYDPQMIVSWHLGGQAEFGLGGNFGLSAGLQLSGKGTRYEFTGDLIGTPFDAKVKEKPLYLQIPLALTFRQSGFYAGVGPYFGFGVGGELTVKATAQGQSDTDSQDMEFGSSDEDFYSSADMGIVLEAGYEIRRIRITASYQLGLNNVVPKDQVDAADEMGFSFKKKNTVIGLSVAYLFGNQ